MLDAVVFFSALGVIPAVYGANQIAGDPADPFKFGRAKRIVKSDPAIFGRGNGELLDLIGLMVLMDIIHVSEDFLLRYIRKSRHGYLCSIDVHAVITFLS